MAGVHARKLNVFSVFFNELLLFLFANLLDCVDVLPLTFINSVC